MTHAMHASMTRCWFVFLMNSCISHIEAIACCLTMSATNSSTATESQSLELPNTAGVLIFVLRYENLGTAESMALPLLAHDRCQFDIGRTSQSGPPQLDGRTLLLSDPFVSRTHARVTRNGIVDIIEDVGSKQGTFVNSVRIERPTPLADGDCIEIGHSFFIYRRTDPLMALRLSGPEAKTVHGPTATLCPEVVQLSQALANIARSDQPVLILAETGAGKEIAARFVHEKSHRTGAFVAIDCGAIPSHLVEGELFGHKRGAFSGAHEERIGRIRSAEGGTVFLDEIGNMPPQAQASLLRVVQEREVTPLGADKSKFVDVRWVAATNADLFSENSGFRADLRARLSGYIARLPPLRQRREDLGFLCAHLLAKHGVRTASITRNAARAMFLSDLPGNVRQLERSLASATLLMGNGPIDVPHLNVLPARITNEHTAVVRESVPATPSHSEDETRERRYTRRPSKDDIEQALVKAKRIQSEAARLLGVHERQLARWMDAYGIERARFGALKNK